MHPVPQNCHFLVTQTLVFRCEQCHHYIELGIWVSIQKSNNKIKEIKNVFFLCLDFANKFKVHFKKRTQSQKCIYIFFEALLYKYIEKKHVPWYAMHTAQHIIYNKMIH